MSLTNILKGWINDAYRGNHQIEELARERGRICFTCPVNTKQNRDLGTCTTAKGGCGCPITKKIRVKNEKCPLNKW